MLAMAVPEEYGGAGDHDFRFNQIVGEEAALAGVAGPGLAITLHNDICLPYFLEYCTDEQRERWLPGIASGELITAVAMTEPGIGSDLASMTTRASRDDGALHRQRLQDVHHERHQRRPRHHRGQDRPSERHRGISLVVVERGMEGFERGRNLDKVGMHAQDTAELFFNDVRVPVENRLGEEGEGFRYLTRNLAQERLSIAVAGVAAARAALEWTLDYVKERTAFGSADRLLPELALRAGGDARRRSSSRRPTSTAASRRSTPAS